MVETNSRAQSAQKSLTTATIKFAGGRTENIDTPVNQKLNKTQYNQLIRQIKALPVYSGNLKV